MSDFHMPGMTDKWVKWFINSLPSQTWVPKKAPTPMYVTHNVQHADLAVGASILSTRWAVLEHGHKGGWWQSFTPDQVSEIFPKTPVVGAYTMSVESARRACNVTDAYHLFRLTEALEMSAHAAAMLSPVNVRISVVTGSWVDILNQWMSLDSLETIPLLALE